MNNNATLKCSVCETSNTFTPAQFNKRFSFVICRKCQFPVAYQNRNTPGGPSQDEFSKYKQIWESRAREYLKSLLMLKEEGKAKAQNQPPLNREFQTDTSKQPDSQELAVNQNQRESGQSKDREAEEKEPETSTELVKAVEANCKNITTLVGRMDKVERGLKSAIASENIGALIGRMNKLESALKSAIASGSVKEKCEEENLGYSKIDADEQKGDGRVETVSIVISPEQERLKNTGWIRVYNENDPDAFVARSSAKRAGATKETMEVNRLAQGGDAIFEIGNGNYWLVTPENQNEAFLVPNRKTFRLNPNTIASLKICFELTHDRSLRNLDFDAQNADMTNVELMYPAILDMANRDKLWQLRQKGVLLFPLDSDKAF